METRFVLLACAIGLCSAVAAQESGKKGVAIECQASYFIEAQAFAYSSVFQGAFARSPILSKNQILHEWSGFDYYVNVLPTKFRLCGEFGWTSSAFSSASDFMRMHRVGVLADYDFGEERPIRVQFGWLSNRVSMMYGSPVVGEGANELTLSELTPNNYSLLCQTYQSLVLGLELAQSYRKVTLGFRPRVAYHFGHETTTGDGLTRVVDCPAIASWSFSVSAFCCYTF